MNTQHLAEIDELIIVIASYLNISELMKLERVCKHWNTLFTSNWTALYLNLANSENHNAFTTKEYHKYAKEYFKDITEGLLNIQCIGNSSSKKRMKSKHKRILLNSSVIAGNVPVPRNARMTMKMQTMSQKKWNLINEKQFMKKVMTTIGLKKTTTTIPAKFSHEVLSHQIFPVVPDNITDDGKFNINLITVCSTCVAFALNNGYVGLMDYSSQEWILPDQFIDVIQEVTKRYHPNLDSHTIIRLSSLKLYFDQKESRKLKVKGNVMKLFVGGNVYNIKNVVYHKPFLYEWKIIDIHNNDLSIYKERAIFIHSYLTNIHELQPFGSLRDIQYEESSNVLLCNINNNILLFKSKDFFGSIGNCELKKKSAENMIVVTNFQENFNDILCTYLMDVTSNCSTQNDIMVLELRVYNEFAYRSSLNRYRISISTQRPVSKTTTVDKTVCEIALVTKDTISHGYGTAKGCFSNSGRYFYLSIQNYTNVFDLMYLDMSRFRHVHINSIHLGISASFNLNSELIGIEENYTGAFLANGTLSIGYLHPILDHHPIRRDIASIETNFEKTIDKFQQSFRSTPNPQLLHNGMFIVSQDFTTSKSRKNPGTISALYFII
jgi:hypothetical protein